MLNLSNKEIPLTSDLIINSKEDNKVEGEL